MKLARTLTALALTSTLLLSGCGSDSGSDGSASDPSSSPAPGGGPGSRPSFDAAQLTAIQECLDAAGVDADLPTDLPSGIPTDLPSGIPSDLPSGIPSDLPSDFTGGPGGAGGGGLGDLLTPEVQQALTACGIELPSSAP